MTELVITLPGRCRPKGSYRPIRTKSGGTYLKSNQDGAWLVANQERLSKAWDAPLLAEPVYLSVRFSFVPPKAWDTKSYQYKAYPGLAQGDVDKLCRTVLDLLTDTVLQNDTWIARLEAEKVWGTKDEVELRLWTL